jgi:hypothetical protein
VPPRPSAPEFAIATSDSTNVAAILSQALAREYNAAGLPVTDTCVTSAAKVTVPSMVNLLNMALDNSLRFPQLSR